MNSLLIRHQSALTFSYPRYLAAKKTVDDRARHPRVWDTFMQAARDLGARSAPRPLRILEIGGGVGDLAIEILQALNDVPVHYILLDAEAENLASARDRIDTYFQSTSTASSKDSAVLLTSQSGIKQHVDFECRTIESIPHWFDEEGGDEAFDALVGQAIMDIIPTSVSLNIASSILSSDGIAYFPIHFDSLTSFEPIVGSEIDSRISSLYHRSMQREYRNTFANVRGAPDDATITSDGARCGRDLIVNASQAGFRILDVGSSDWIVRPDARTAEYPSQEAYFLECMLHFIEAELMRHPDLDDAEFERWIETRRRQIDERELILIVHNLDVLLTRR